jgi:hypothetical protein
MTKISLAELTISRSLRAVEIAQFERPIRYIGTIAIDGEHSSPPAGWRDRYATNGITPASKR